MARKARGRKADSQTPPKPRQSQATRMALWIGLGLAPPLAAGLVLLLFGSAEESGVISGIGATVINFGLLIMALTTFNVIFQARSQWAGPRAAPSTYLSGLASTAGVAVGGLVAYLLTGSLLTALVLMVVSLGGAIMLRPLR